MWEEGRGWASVFGPCANTVMPGCATAMPSHVGDMHRGCSATLPPHATQHIKAGGEAGLTSQPVIRLMS